MTVQTIRIENLTLTPTTPAERATWLGASVRPECSEITVKTADKGIARVRFTTSLEIEALEQALRVMRLRIEEAERAALTK